MDADFAKVQIELIASWRGPIPSSFLSFPDAVNVATCTSFCELVEEFSYGARQNKFCIHEFIRITLTTRRQLLQVPAKGRQLWQWQKLPFSQFFVGGVVKVFCTNQVTGNTKSC